MLRGWLWLFEIIYIIRYFFNLFLVMARRVRRGVVRGVLSLPWGDGTGQVVELTGGSGGLWYCDGGLWLGGFPRGRRFCAYVGSEGFEKRVLGGRFSESFWSIGSSVRCASAGVGSEGVVYFRSGMFGVLPGVSGFSLSDSVVVRGTGDSLVPGKFNVVVGNTFDWEFVRFGLDGDALSVVLRTTGSNDGSGDVGFCDVSLWCPLVLGGGLGFRDSVVGRLYQGGSVVSGCSVIYGGYRVWMVLFWRMFLRFLVVVCCRSCRRLGVLVLVWLVLVVFWMVLLRFTGCVCVFTARRVGS